MRYELATRTLAWSLTQYPDSEPLKRLEETAFLKLKEKHQAFNPFKFIIYSEQIGHETPPMDLNGAGQQL